MGVSLNTFAKGWQTLSTRRFYLGLKSINILVSGPLDKKYPKKRGKVKLSGSSAKINDGRF